MDVEDTRPALILARPPADGGAGQRPGESGEGDVLVGLQIDACAGFLAGADFSQNWFRWVSQTPFIDPDDVARRAWRKAYEGLSCAVWGGDTYGAEDADQEKALRRHDHSAIPTQ